MDGDQQTSAGPGGAPGPAVLAAVAELAQVVDSLAVTVQASAWTLSDAQSRDAVRAMVAGHARVESVVLGLVRDLDSRPGAVAGARAGSIAHTFLTTALRRTGHRAGRDVRAAQALDAAVAPGDQPGDQPGDPLSGAAGAARMPALAAAFAAGLVSREHVDIAVRAVRALPNALRRKVDPDGIAVGSKADTYLTDQARVVDPDTFRAIADHLRAYLDPEHEQFDAEAYARRFLTMRVGDDGMVVGRFAVPAAQGAAIMAAVDSLCDPQPPVEVLDQDDQPVLVGDERTLAQRKADALTAICRHFLGCDSDPHGDGTRRGDSQIVVITDLDQVAAAHAAQQPRGVGLRPGTAHCVQTGPIPPATLQALACDAVLQAVVLDRSGAVLDLGRTVRTVTPAQRRALLARDRGCVIPGCHAPPSRCEAHHVRWWSTGGATDLDNLALVCGRHHADIHAGVWAVVIENGVPYGIPPSWADPARPKLRNTVHHAADLARRLATQLVLDLIDPPRSSDPPDP